jgi:23S rRNA (pseudouridine1915-N3)-methyltransferase
MINIVVIAVGKLKESYLIEGVKEYRKRIEKYAKVEIIELPDEKNPSNDSLAEIQRIKEMEGKAILQKLPKDGTLITLEIEGEMVSSEELASSIDSWTQFQGNRLIFIIGGSHGLSDEVKAKANQALSFSKMTFPHQLMRLILMEQLYRALSILNHSSYHK